MTGALSKHFFSPEEYLALEETAEYKSEYYNGVIFAMAGGSLNHNRITSNINAELNIALRGRPCSVFSSDMRLLVKKNGLYTYPDTAVVCGKVELVEGRNDTITNPILLVEVLSPSTKNYDLKGKFALYQALSSLQSYVVIDQERVYVEYYQRTGSNKWELETYENLTDALSIKIIEVKLALEAIYDKVEFD